MTNTDYPRKFDFSIAITLSCLVFFACNLSGGAGTTPTDTLSSTSTSEIVSTNTQVPTIPPTITFTPEPTETPRPTVTPRPTNTPRPTSTPTPIPEPIIITGSGDNVVDLDKWSGPAILHVIYNGSGNFVIWNYGPDGEEIDLLINTIGEYDGKLALDFLDNYQTTRFQIESSGDWELRILPIEEIRREVIPGTFSGNGDDVVYLNGENPDLLRVDATSAEANFVIWSYGDSRELLVNEIAPYDGVVILGSEVLVLAIHAEGDWTLEVTTK